MSKVVYVLVSGEYDSYGIKAVFSDKEVGERARDLLKSAESNPDTVELLEWECSDDPGVIHYASRCTKDGLLGSYTCKYWVENSSFEYFKSQQERYLGIALNALPTMKDKKNIWADGVGLTKEEADQNAKDNFKKVLKAWTELNI